MKLEPPFCPPVNGGKLDERNRVIRRRWQELRDGKVRPGRAIEILIEEFHLSDKRIDEIVYETERRRGVERHV